MLTMAPGIKIFSLILTVTAFSGAVASLDAQSRTPSQSTPPATTTSERTGRNSGTGEGAQGRRTAQQGRNPGSDQQNRNRNNRRTLTPTEPAQQSGSVITVTPIPIVVPTDVAIDIPSVFEVMEVIDEDTPAQPTWDYLDGWTPRLKAGYSAHAASYGMGADILIPAGMQANSELFVRVGGLLFSKSPEFIINGEAYESQSGLFTAAIMLKNIHYSAQNSYGEYRFYSAVGAGPVFGVAFPMNFDGGMSERYARWSLAGELFGSLGTEFVLKSNIGFYAEAGISYLQFAGRSFSTAQQIISPTFSVGIRFY